MASTPQQTSQDSGHISSYMSSMESTPITLVRKRKYLFESHTSLDGSPSTPKFSSTLNESLMREFSQCCLDPEPPRKLAKIHATPEKQIAARDETHRRPSSYHKLPEESPLREAQRIKYPSLPPLGSARNLFSPKKKAAKAKRDSPLVCKTLFTSRKHLLHKILVNHTIMENIFKRLSDGDLFRFSQVSPMFKLAVIYEHGACRRFNVYSDVHKNNKENYEITPPGSPERATDSPPSPNSFVFRKFADRACQLNKDQSMIKCPKCENPSIVENNIAQCDSAICGYIFCRKCESYSYKVEDFTDKCSGSYLSRTTFSDLSNSSFFGVSLDNNHNKESGIYSDFENHSARRSLSFSASTSSSGVKVLGSNANRSVEKPKQWRRSSLAVVVKQEVQVEVQEPPPSPPKVRQYVAGSKESKRNLKRLTR